MAGFKQGDSPILWSADGRSLFVARLDTAPAELYAVNLRAGERRLWKTFMPPDPAGVNAVVPVFTPDGQSYAYSYGRNLSELLSGGREYSKWCAKIARHRSFAPPKKCLEFLSGRMLWGLENPIKTELGHYQSFRRF